MKKSLPVVSALLHHVQGTPEPQETKATWGSVSKGKRGSFTCVLPPVRRVQTGRYLSVRV